MSKKQVGVSELLKELSELVVKYNENELKIERYQRMQSTGRSYTQEILTLMHDKMICRVRVDRVTNEIRRMVGIDDG